MLGKNIEREIKNNKLSLILESNATYHEKWFENSYLKPLGLCNKKIRTNDFEGIICNSNNGQELTVFELKLVTLPHLQERVCKEFVVANNALISYPGQEAIVSRLREIISKAMHQVFEKEKSRNIPRIIFLMISTPDVHVDIGVSIVRAVKGETIIVFPEGINTSESEISQNKDTDLFYNDNLSGIICIHAGMVEHRGISILKNIKAKNKIPSEFLVNVEIKEI